MRTGFRTWCIRVSLVLGLVLAGPAAHADSPNASAQRTMRDEALRLTREAEELKQKKKYDDAIKLAEKAVGLREKASGPDSLEVVAGIKYLAELYQAKGDYARAVPLLKRALAIREKHRGLEHIEVMFAVEDLASACSKAEEYVQAISLYERALKLAEKRSGAEGRDVVRLLIPLGKALRQKGDFAQAEALLVKAVAMGRKLSREDRGIFPSVLLTLGRLYVEKAQYAKAEPLFVEALALHEKAFGARNGATPDTMSELGTLYMRMGDFNRAETLLGRVATIEEEESGPTSLNTAHAVNLLGLLYHEKGDYARAEQSCLRALEIRGKALPLEHPDIAQSKLSVGSIYLSKRDLTRAEPLITAALASWEKAFGPTHRNVATPVSMLAELHRLKGNHARAEELFHRALAIHEKTLGQGHPTIAADRTSLGRLSETRGDVAGAQRSYEQALAIREKVLGASHPDVAASVYDLAELHRRANQPVKAEPLYKRALGIYEKSVGPDHTSVAASLEGLAALYVADGKLDAAIASQVRSADIYEHHIGLILAAGSEAQKRDYMATLSSSTDFTVALHAQAAPKNASAQRLALSTILQRKGRVLDVMADSLAAFRKRLGQEDLKLLGDLAAARARLAAASLRGPGEMPLEAYRKDLAQMEEEAQKLEAKLSGKGAAFRWQEAPASVERVQAAMPEQSVLVEYFIYRPRRPADSPNGSRWGAPRYVVYTLTPAGKISFADLGEIRPIDELVQALRKVLASPDSKDNKELARALDEKVMRPVRGLLGSSTKVLLSPDGALNLVPFAALVDEQGHYLVERFELTYLTSGRDLLRLQFHAAPKSGPLIVANPAFGRPQSAESVAVAADRSGDLGKAVFTPLPGTAGEARALSTIFPDAALRVDTEATETVLKEVHAPKIVHVATHGFFLANQTIGSSEGRGLVLDAGSAQAPPTGVAENPLLRSGLALAGANGRRSGQEDGILTALEASGLDLQGTKLVVLSACETGLGDVQNGNGVAGLRRAFLMAGAETQVVSLWKVADEETRDLMVRYYKKLSQGAGRSAALRDVQLAMMAQPATAHPYFWASFLASGESAPIGESSVAPPAVTARQPAASAGQTANAAAAKVAPGARGCTCEVTLATPRGPLPAAAVIAALGCAGAAVRRMRRRR